MLKTLFPHIEDMIRAQPETFWLGPGTSIIDANKVFLISKQFNPTHVNNKLQFCAFCVNNLSLLLCKALDYYPMCTIFKGPPLAIYSI